MCPLHSGKCCFYISTSIHQWLHWSHGQRIQTLLSHIPCLVRTEPSHGIHSYLGNLQDQTASAESLKSGSEHALPLLPLDGMAELHGQSNTLVVLRTWIHCVNHAVFIFMKLCLNGCAVHALPAQSLHDVR